MKKFRRILLLFMIFNISLLAWMVFDPSTPVNQFVTESIATPTPTEPTQAPTQMPIESIPTQLPTAEPTQPSTEPSILPTPTASPKSILDFLKIAAQPVGKTMYVWGGGWNEEDTAAGIEAVSLGVSPVWEAFAAQQNAAYDYNTTRYQIHNGLDCSGFVGWAVYNVLETENGKEGYVFSSTKMAQTFAEQGFGQYIATEDISRWQAGDIMSMSGHVWISLGMCDDGSVLMLHASPPGVIFCGTSLADGNKSQAVILAEQIMSTYYPEWHAKYPNCARSYSYLTNSSAMRWSRQVLRDEENLSAMRADEVVQYLFDSI